MKRLIKKAFGKTLYHGTSLDNLKKITEMGMIVPQESSSGGDLGDVSFEAAGERAEERMEEEGIDVQQNRKIFLDYRKEEMEKEKAKYEGFTFFTDMFANAQSYSASYYPLFVIEVSLPEDSLLPDDNDCPKCKNWQESLNEIGQVKVLGTITSDYIVGVHITTAENEDQFYPKLTWIDEYKEK